MNLTKKQSRKLTILCSTASKLKELTGKQVYDEIKLFELLYQRLLNQPVLFNYTYERVLSNIFEKVSIDDQVEEFQRLLRLNSLNEEFNNPEQWQKVSNY